MFQKIIPSSDSKHKQKIIWLHQNDININKKYCQSAQKMLMWWTPTLCAFENCLYICCSFLSNWNKIRTYYLFLIKYSAGCQQPFSLAGYQQQSFLYSTSGHRQPVVNRHNLKFYLGISLFNVYSLMCQLTLSALQSNRDKFAKEVDPIETAHNELSHLDLHCLPLYSWLHVIADNPIHYK